jgi:hypothetical protein
MKIFLFEIVDENGDFIHVAAQDFSVAIDTVRNKCKEIKIRSITKKEKIDLVQISKRMPAKEAESLCHAYFEIP